jgi:hypothetical protein
VPTVVNNGTAVKFWNNMVFRPREEKRLDFFVPSELGLTVLSEEPRVSPRCLVAGEISVSENVTVEIAVPYCNVFRASFICFSGAVDIRQNYANAQAVSINPNIEYEIQYRRADVEKIIITGVEDASVAYDIERVA